MVRHAVCDWSSSGDETPGSVNQLTSIFELEADQALQLRTAHNELKSFLVSDLLSLVELNRDAQAALDDEFRREYVASERRFRTSATSLFQRRALLSLLNFASTVYAYQQHSEILAGRLSADTEVDVKQRFSDYYNAMPALFLIVKIRHVLVRNRLRIISLEARSNLVENDWSRMVHTALRLDYEGLKGNKNLNASLRAHLAAVGPDIDVLDAMDRALTDLRKINDDLMPVLYPTLIKSAAMVVTDDITMRQARGNDHNCVLVEHPDEGLSHLDTRSFDVFLLVGEQVSLAYDLVEKEHARLNP
jgi:hypothetical protein